METTPETPLVEQPPYLAADEMPERRLAAWQKIRGAWKGRTPDPIEWMEESRKSWDRDVAERQP